MMLTDVIYDNRVGSSCSLRRACHLEEKVNHTVKHVKCSIISTLVVYLCPRVHQADRLAWQRNQRVCSSCPHMDQEVCVSCLVVYVFFMFVFLLHHSSLTPPTYRSHAREAGLNSSTIEHMMQSNDIHIHFPEGAQEKDGPSAGVALVSVLVSLFSNRYHNPINQDYALLLPLRSLFSSLFLSISVVLEQTLL